MSRLIDKLNRLSRPGSQPIGFRAAPLTAPKPRIQLVATLTQDSAESLTGHMSGADAGLLRISKLSTGVKALQKISQSLPDIPWGGWLQGSGRGGIKQLSKAGCDLIVFPATNTPLALIENAEVGRILEVEASLSEGLLRATNELPIDAVLIAGEQREGHSLTWQHLMLFQRFADLLTRPLLVSIPVKVTAGELQLLWDTGVAGVVVELTTGQPPDRLVKLRQVIDKLSLPSPRRQEKAGALLPHISRESSLDRVEEEEEEDEDEDEEE